MRIYIYLLRRSQQVARQSLCQSLLLDNVSSLMMMFAGLSCDMRSQFELLARPARYLLQVSNEDRRTVSPAKTMYDEPGGSEEMSIF